MYVCMYVCIYVCMYVYMHVCMCMLCCVCPIELLKDRQSDSRRGAYETSTDNGIGANSSGTFTGVSKHIATASDKRAQSESEERYREIIARYKRLIADEKKSLSMYVYVYVMCVYICLLYAMNSICMYMFSAIIRTNYDIELRARTEMELLLRNCVEDVRKEIQKRYKYICVYPYT